MQETGKILKTAASGTKSIIHILVSIGQGISCAFIFIMMLVIMADVVARKFTFQLWWTIEVSGYLLVVVTFLGAAYALKEGAHINVDLLVGRLSPRGQKWLTLVTLLLAFIFLLVFVVSSWNFVLRTHADKIVSNTKLAYPQYIPQLFIPIGLTMMALQFVIEIIKAATRKIQGA